MTLPKRTTASEKAVLAISEELPPSLIVAVPTSILWGRAGNGGVESAASVSRSE